MNKYTKAFLKTDELVAKKEDLEKYYLSHTENLSFTNDEGITLTATKFIIDDPIARIVIIPGRGEIAHKYYEFFYTLGQLRIGAVICFARGQATSSRLLENRQKCHIEHFEDFAKDICFILDKLNITNYKLLAFSLGGLISLDIIKNMPNKPEKAALIAPYIWPYFKLNKTLLKLFVNTLGTLPYSKTMYTPHGKEYKKVPFEINHHSHNQVRYDNYHDYYAKHPAYTIGGPTFKFVKEALRKQLELIKGKFDFTIPVYVQAAGDDKVVSTKESQAYFLSHQHDTIPPKYEIIDNAYHDILNEDDQYRIKCLANALKFLIG